MTTNNLTAEQMRRSIAFLECDISAQTFEAEARRLNRLVELHAAYRAVNGDEAVLDAAIAAQRRRVADAQRDGEYDHPDW